MHEVRDSRGTMPVMRRSESRHTLRQLNAISVSLSPNRRKMLVMCDHVRNAIVLFERTSICDDESRGDTRAVCPSPLCLK